MSLRRLSRSADANRPALTRDAAGVPGPVAGIALAFLALEVGLAMLAADQLIRLKLGG